MAKYKYYLKKPKGEIVKDVLGWFITGGAIAIAATSPYFGTNLLRAFLEKKPYKRKKAYDTFYRLWREGCIKTEKRNHQIYIRLTEKGKSRAGMYQINDLKIKTPQRWDKKWRLVIFDIAELKRFKRDAFRGILRNLGMVPLQQSVWVYPHHCKDEIDLLRDFFGLTSKELRLAVADTIGDDAAVRKQFSL